MRQLFFAGLSLALWLVTATPAAVWATDATLYFPPEWSGRTEKAAAIAAALSRDSGVRLEPVVARSYSEILTSFAADRPALVYVGSFAQAILRARSLATPLVQGVDGKEFYSSVLVVPAAAGDDPVAAVRACGSKVSFAVGASSGESGAKAATNGTATVGRNHHRGSVNAIRAGRVNCAFVKNWWWEANKGKYPMLKRLDYPGVSTLKNPDNLLSANRAFPAAELERIKAAAGRNASVFGVTSFRDFDGRLLEPTLELMRKAQIDPATYAW